MLRGRDMSRGSMVEGSDMAVCVEVVMLGCMEGLGCIGDVGCTAGPGCIQGAGRNRRLPCAAGSGAG